MENNKDYNREDEDVIRSLKSRLDKNESLEEASRKMMEKFAKEMYRNKEVRSAIAKDCLERINGRKVSPYDPSRLAGKDGARITANAINEDLPTGYEKLPWDTEEE